MALSSNRLIRPAEKGPAGAQQPAVGLAQQQQGSANTPPPSDGVSKLLGVINAVEAKNQQTSHTDTPAQSSARVSLHPDADVSTADFVLPPDIDDKASQTEVKIAPLAEIKPQTPPESAPAAPKRHTLRLTGNTSSLGATGKLRTVSIPGNATQEAETVVQPETPAITQSSAPSPVPEFIDEPMVARKGEDWAPGSQKPHKTKHSEIAPIIFLIVLLLLLFAVGAYLLLFILKADEKPHAVTRSKVPTAASSVSPDETAVDPVVDVPSDDETPSDGEIVDIPQDDDADGLTNQVSAVSQTNAPAGSVEVEVTVESVPEIEVIPAATTNTPKTSTAEATPTNEVTASVSKFVPPWLRKKDASKAETPSVAEAPEAIDVPEAKEWPTLKVSAVVGTGKKGSALVNGEVVSVGEELEDGPVLKSITRQAAVFEWDGETRTVFVSSKIE